MKDASAAGNTRFGHRPDDGDRGNDGYDAFASHERILHEIL